MLTLTLPDRQTLTADTDVMLANLLAAHRYGNDWDADLCPFDEHTIMGELLEELALIADGTLDGHTLTDTHNECLLD
ncbi:hypothetical protein [Plantibacter sp. CFBP 8804]|uniref:hypothetical protein n=1 Tax=Plantibacter sp. CFBP 8804 TaxID=2775270 RepID=UPI00177BB8E3|nr:hypothetical protein [Plantibacter sp. CFBP 8804]MBD8519177.1 hypothetical protein [Plantibacter sp. CFBP 8804]